MLFYSARYLFSALLLSSVVSSAPSIDIDLHAAFQTPPFILELLESTAAENSSAYFPLLLSIASNRIKGLASLSDQQLFTAFKKAIEEDGHISDASRRSSWELAVASRESTPRIESQFQYWRTTIDPSGVLDPDSKEGRKAVDVLCAEKRHRAGESCVARDIGDGQRISYHVQRLDFDRQNGPNALDTGLVVYADVASPSFPEEYENWIQELKGQSFVLRYKPPVDASDTALAVSGYGVDLALKRTDYIVIDDRETEDAEEKARKRDNSEIKFDDTDISDVKPLSASELRNLGLNTASYIMRSEDPFDTLGRISQDFPKYSAALAQNNATQAFKKEHWHNREIVLRPGSNIIWLNGQQLSPREFDVFSLLDIIRQERTIIDRLRSVGLTSKDAVELISHPTLALAKNAEEPQRYDYRDEVEGGNVITWLNDIEKDKRYYEWPATVQAYLQRVFPGQMPQVKKNAQQVLYLVDLTDPEDIVDVVKNLQSFVKGEVAVRFGLVPYVNSEASSRQARIFYHLHESYGLSAIMTYLQNELQVDDSRKTQAVFESTIATAKVRNGQEALSFEQVLGSENLDLRVAQARKYSKRLGAGDIKPPIFANGVAISHVEGWMQPLSQQLSMDLRTIQQGVFEETLTEETNIPLIFLNESSLYRDPLLIPENENNITLADLTEIYSDWEDVTKQLRPLGFPKDEATRSLTNIIVIGDLNEESSADFVLTAAEFGYTHPDIDVEYLHVPVSAEERSSMDLEAKIVERILDSIETELSGLAEAEMSIMKTSLQETLSSSRQAEAPPRYQGFLNSLGLTSGQKAVILNGRVIPLGTDRSLTARDLEVLYSYERKKRLDPAVAAVEDLDLDEKLQTPLATAKISTVLALSAMGGQEGIFERPNGPRTNVYDHWNTTETCITIGDSEDARLHFVVVLDPSSETAQKWVPILKVLSTIDGLYLKLFLNPAEKLSELPTKRFYRHVLSATPHFSEDGKFDPQGAHLTGIPEDALLSTTIDVPPSWLVAPKESIHDLDNLKLSSLSAYSSIQASYELESILIEGHSRDITLGNPPRGAQLILGTDANPDFAGTIIMANLGYFQFKATPGVYHMRLKPGASDRIYNLDSVSAAAFGASKGDSDSQITLSSFKGATVFPRLSRKSGMEYEDVLETNAGSASKSSLMSKGAGVAEDILTKVGVPDTQAQEYVAKFANWGQSILGMAPNETAVTPKKHADINIFSVASGHLYERMLNIMMLSVMKHTQHTVKFWFIEQFLSPSFKIFLPTIAAEYGFEYEMVTYKWPHWLRQQTEKQRTIWGYKILFLDVLFPLDLDKVIFVDADQIVRTDMHELIEHDLKGAAYGFTPMCDSRTEMEGFRFWKTGYWENFLRGKPYHISALYVVDLKRFRQIAAGDRLRQQYHSLSADPNSLSNLDQDLPNNMQHQLPIHSLPQEWLWCETWCSDESLKDAKTIDLCNNPQTKEPKLERARRQVPEWNVYDREIAALAKRSKEEVGGVLGGGSEQERQNEAEKKLEL